MQLGDKYFSDEWDELHLNFDFFQIFWKNDIEYSNWTRKSGH